jgi:hypothetical protein
MMILVAVRTGRTHSPFALSGPLSGTRTAAPAISRLQNCHAGRGVGIDDAADLVAARLVDDAVREGHGPEEQLGHPQRAVAQQSVAHLRRRLGPPRPRPLRGASIRDPREQPTWQTRFATFMPKTFMRRACDEIVGMSQPVMTSGLDWTIVRFLAPKDGPAGGQLRQGFYGTDKLGFAVTRADIAAFTAAQVDDSRYISAAPAISN